MESFRVVVGSEKVRKGGTVPRIALAGAFLKRAGFHSGGRADVVSTEGKVLVLPQQPVPVHQAQAAVDVAAEQLAAIRDALILVYAGLPDGSRSMLDGRTPMLAGPEVKAILACIVTDNLEPAIEALREASTVTNEDLREDFYVARDGRLPYPPLPA